MSHRFAGTLACAVIGLLCTLDGSELGLVSAGFLLAASATLAAIDTVKHGPGDAGLLTLCTVFFLMAYPVNAIVFTFAPSTANVMLPTDAETLCFSIQVGGLGWLMLLLGYRTAASQLARGEPPAWKRSMPDFAWDRLAAIAALGVPLRAFVQLYFFSEDSESTFSSVGQIPNAVAGMCMICSCALMAAPRRNYRIAAVCLISAYSVTGLFSGQRSDALMPWFLFALSRLFRPRPARVATERRRAWMGLAVLGVVLIVTFPILTSFKLAMNKVRSQTSGMDRFREGLRTWGEVLGGEGGTDVSSESEGMGANLLHLCVRYSHLQYGSQLITKGVAEWGYLGGQSLVEAVIVFVPRFLWPEKPEIGLGPRAYHLMGYKDTGSATVPISADWYLNFGMPGVIGGMLLVGAGYAVVNYLLRREDPLAYALLASLSYDLMQSGQGIANALAIVFMRVCLIWAMRPFVVRRYLAPASDPERPAWSAAVGT
jgi:hypothetical protein